MKLIFWWHHFMRNQTIGDKDRCSCLSPFSFTQKLPYQFREASAQSASCYPYLLKSAPHNICA